MEAEKKKQKEDYARKIFCKNDEENLYCVCVDGSKHSEYSFDFVAHYLLKPDERLLLIHIFNDKLDDIYNYENKKATVISTYNDKLIPFEQQSLFYSENRSSEIHVLEQVNKISCSYRSNFLVVGLFGIKGPRADKKELSKGINYLLGYSKAPVIIIQENIMKNMKERKNLKWLFVADRQYSYCNKIFSAFFPLVNKEDIVHGLTLLPPHINFDDIEKEFLEETSNRQFTNVSYESLQYDKTSYAKELVDKVNFGQPLYDFVVFYNNNEKYRVQGEKSDSYFIASRCKANLCFVY